jgi:hypothetical protein
MAPAGCWCDTACTTAGDCCDGFEGACLAWPKVFPQAATSAAHAVAADDPGNAYLAAQVAGTWDPGGGPIATTANDSLIVSWTGLGAFRWAARLTSDGGVVSVRSMKVSGGRVYVVGQFTGSVLRREGAALLARPGGSLGQAFLLALHALTGTLRWVRAPVGHLSASFNDVATDGANNPITAGEVRDGTRSGVLFSYDPFGVFRWSGPAALPAPFSRLAVDDGNTSYVLGAAGQTLSAYGGTEGRSWFRTLIHNGVFHDVATHTDKVVAVGACFEGCAVAGGPTAAGALIADFMRGDGGHRLTYVHLLANRIARVDIARGNNPTMLGDYREGPMEVGGAAIGSAGFGGVFSSTMDAGGTPFASQLVAQVALPARIDAGDLALSAGLPRFATVNSAAPIVVDGAPYDTTAPRNGLLMRLR